MLKRCFVLLAIASCADDGRSFLIDTTAEPAGSNCASGGTRIDVGEDDNGNGMLESGEVTSTEYACNGGDGTNGSNGTSERVKLTDEPPGANCANGGTRVDTGPDANGNGTLDAGEIASTQYVCDGGVGQVVDVFSGGEVDFANDTSATLQTASITAPAAGKVIAIASVDVTCSSATGTGFACQANHTPASDFCLSITTNATASGCTDDVTSQSFAWLQPNVTETMSRTTMFTVAENSTTQFYVRGSTSDNASTGEAGAWRRQLTLIYVPN